MNDYITPDQLMKGHCYEVNGFDCAFLGAMFNGPNPRQYRFKGDGPNSFKTLTESEAWKADIRILDQHDHEPMNYCDSAQFYGPSARI